MIDYTKDNILEIVEKGKKLLEIQKKELDESAKKATERTIIINDKIYTVWLGYTTGDRSTLGNMLANKLTSKGILPDFSATWTFDNKLNEWWISLRGHDDSPDLSLIAQNYGGGGHKLSSSFTIKFPTTLDDIFIIK